VNPRGVPSPPVQGATVLHSLARLFETAIQSATKGATECNVRCYKVEVGSDPRPINPKVGANKLLTPGAN